MNHRDIAAFTAGLAPVIRDYVVDACKGFGDVLKGFGDRLLALEQRPPERGEKGLDGKDGRDGLDGTAGIDGKDGAPGPQGEKGLDGAAGLPGERGSDGLQGKDGAPGRDGRDGLPGVQGEKGLDGRDGLDGFGFDDMSPVFDGERTVTFRFVQGDRVVEFPITFPTMIDRGVWREGEFKQGDAVSFGGSLFIAQRTTSAKPETSDCGWRLAVKRGRDGKDGKPGLDGKPGRDGKQ